MSSRRALFGFIYYVDPANNLDLNKAYVTHALDLIDIQIHWLQHGIQGRRRASAFFSVGEYQSRYLDVSRDPARAILEYVTDGQSKQRPGRAAWADPAAWNSLVQQRMPPDISATPNDVERSFTSARGSPVKVVVKSQSWYKASLSPPWQELPAAEICTAPPPTANDDLKMIQSYLDRMSAGSKAPCRVVRLAPRAAYHLAERYNLSVADAHIATARLRPNPVLSLYSDLQDLAGTGFNAQNMAGPPEYGIRTDFIFERGQKQRYRIEVAEQQKAVAQWQLLNTVRSLALDVQNAFVEVLLAKETLALAERNKESFHRIVEVSKERLRVGDLAQVELTRTQLAELQFNNAVIQAPSRLRIGKQRLQLLMGRAEPSELFDVAGEMRNEPLPFTLEELWRQAIARRPDYQATERDQARSVAELRSQIAQGKVDYTIGAEFRRQQGIAGTGNSLGFFFSVPLPVFNRNQGEISRAREERQQVEARTRALEAVIRNELDAAWRQYDTSRALLARIEGEMLDQARSVLISMEYSYRAGEASLVEFLGAQRAFNDTMQGYNEARAEYARSLYLIDSVTGKEAL